MLDSCGRPSRFSVASTPRVEERAKRRASARSMVGATAPAREVFPRASDTGVGGYGGAMGQRRSRSERVATAAAGLAVATVSLLAWPAVAHGQGDCDAVVVDETSQLDVGEVE